MQRLVFLQPIIKLLKIECSKSSKYCIYNSRLISSSQNLNERKVTNMETNELKMNSEKVSQDSTCNATYAQVLAKQVPKVTDVSNNNPSQLTEVLNGNENMSAKDEVSVTSESSKTSNLSDVSQSDSYEDAEENLLVNSTSTVKSNDFVTNTASSLVTADSSDSKPVDQSNSNSSGSSESGDEADLEDEAVIVDELYPSALKMRFRSNAELDLPETVTVLETSYGCKVFLVGTAHFSTESQEDVAKTIKAIQPDVVMIELCKHRINILSLDEETILQESNSMNFQKMRAAISQNGFLQGALFLLLLNMSAYITRQLGMAPGGEFRRAYLEAKKVPGCLVLLGDRPIHITLQRALAKLSLWQKLRAAWYMLRAKDPVSKEEIERCKQKDLLEEMLAEMTGEFPELSHVFVKERDIYLTYSLQTAAVPVPYSTSQDAVCPSYVVGVVGIGHVPGIEEHWGKVTEKDITDIMFVPEPSLSSKVTRFTIRYSLLGLCLYGAYKLIPKSWIPTGYVTNLFKR